MPLENSINRVKEFNQKNLVKNHYNFLEEIWITPKNIKMGIVQKFQTRPYDSRTYHRDVSTSVEKYLRWQLPRWQVN